jgi:hypothetical protein
MPSAGAFQKHSTTQLLDLSLLITVPEWIDFTMGATIAWACLQKQYSTRHFTTSNKKIFIVIEMPQNTSSYLRYLLTMTIALIDRALSAYHYDRHFTQGQCCKVSLTASLSNIIWIDCSRFSLIFIALQVASLPQIRTTSVHTLYFTLYRQVRPEHAVLLNTMERIFFSWMKFTDFINIFHSISSSLYIHDFSHFNASIHAKRAFPRYRTENEYCINYVVDDTDQNNK